MAMFGFVVLCVLSAICALILLGLLVLGATYLISYIVCDFRARKRRWTVEAHDRQIIKYLEHLSKYRSEECESEDEVEDEPSDDEDLTSEDAVEEEKVDSSQCAYDDVISDIIK